MRLTIKNILPDRGRKCFKDDSGSLVKIKFNRFRFLRYSVIKNKKRIDNKWLMP